MAIDLVSIVTQFLTPETVQKLSYSIGADGSQVQAAIGAAVPALLAGFAGTATHGGAQKVADAVNQQSGSLDQLTGSLGAGAGSIADTGSKMLGSLIGTNGQTAIASAVAKFSGMGQSVATALLGALAPIVLGVIGKQAGPKGFDASSLKNLFEAQKPNIANAMPTRFAGLLQDNGILDAVSDTTAAATSAAKSTARSASTAASNSSRWLYWLVPLVILVGFFWYLASRGQPDTASVPPPATSTNLVNAQNLTIGGIDVGKAVGDNLTMLRSTLEGVTDTASAQAALPRLTTVTNGFDQVSTALGSASAEQKAAVAAMAGPLVTAIQPLIDQVLAIPGVGDVLKPAIDGLKAKLATLTTA